MKEILESVLEYKYSNIELIDGLALHEFDIYIELKNATKVISPDENSQLYDKYLCFEAALDILAFEFFRYKNHGSAEVDNLDLESNVGELNINDLIELCVYYDIIENEFAIEVNDENDEFITNGKEKISRYRLEKLVAKRLSDIVDFYLCMIKTFLRYKQSKEFWYRLYCDENSTDKEAFEEIDYIVNALLRVF